MQTSGKPLEDAVRKLLHMSDDGVDSSARLTTSKVTPLHIYVAKKIATSSLTLPPGHLPLPLPLLGLFLYCAVRRRNGLGTTLECQCARAFEL